MTATPDILTPDELALLRRGYDPAEMTSIGVQTLMAYPPSLGYVRAIAETFYGELPSDDAKSRDQLSIADRERCLIAILATRGAGLALALHIYVALVHEISPAEVAHILLLAGVYSGVDNFAQGLEVETTALETLKRLIAEGHTRPRDVYDALRAAFPR